MYTGVLHRLLARLDQHLVDSYVTRGSDSVLHGTCNVGWLQDLGACTRVDKGNRIARQPKVRKSQGDQGSALPHQSPSVFWIVWLVCACVLVPVGVPNFSSASLSVDVASRPVATLPGCTQVTRMPESAVSTRRPCDTASMKNFEAEYTLSPGNTCRAR